MWINGNSIIARSGFPIFKKKNENEIWKEFFKYSGGCGESGVNGQCGKRDTEEEAKAACLKVWGCNAVTKTGYGYELRAGTGLGNSGSGETTWLCNKGRKFPKKNKNKKNY